MEGKSGKIFVESAEQARRNELLEEFWETYMEGNPEDALAKELETLMTPEEWAAAHEIYESKGTEAARDFFDQWPQKQSEEYYPGVFNAELEVPDDPKRVKAGGGAIRKAMSKLQKRILEDFEEYSELKIEVIDTHADPQNPNYIAVRAIDDNGQEHQFLYDTYAEDAMDGIEEMEFTTWPPTVGKPKPLGNFAGGGSVKKALASIKKARYELEESSDPDIDLIARAMMKDPDTKALGRRIMDNERRVADPTMTEKEFGPYYERISRLFDEAIEKLEKAAAEAED